VQWGVRERLASAGIAATATKTSEAVRTIPVIVFKPAKFSNVYPASPLV
jgi:hypothetical protein